MNLNFEEEIKRTKRKKMLKECCIWLVEIAAVILLAYLLIHFCFLRICTVGSAMEPTLYNGEDVFINTKAYLVFSPDREDVIAFYDQGSLADGGEGETPLIYFRRIIGMPGEKIQIEGNTIKINGKEWKESYVYAPMVTAGIAEQEIALGEDEYFVLCDSRVDSDDSRSKAFGNVKKEQIIGKVSFRYQPFSRVTGPNKLPQESGQPQ